MKAVVLFSGGLDSSVCLGLAVRQYGAPEVLALSVAYGQRHLKELEAARKIHGLGAKNVVLKAARIFDNKTVDLLYDGKDAIWLRGEKVNTSWTHGAGCSFSACVTAELAKGKSVAEAVAMAREFVRCGLEHSFALNQFVGPIYHKALSKFNPVVAGK